MTGARRVVIGVLVAAVLLLSGGAVWAASSSQSTGRGDSTGQSLADAEIDTMLSSVAALPPATTPVLQPVDPAPAAPVAVVGRDGRAEPIEAAALLPSPGQSSSAVPQLVLSAYQHAASLIATAQPSCQLPWWILAGIGKIESGHAAGGRVDKFGTTRGRIVGPRLDGSTPGTAVVRDTDRGRLDGDPVFDRAVGPMQFLPSTWQRWASDGNEDGRADPHNVFDASLAAGRYLCAAGGNLAREDGQSRAILAYNRSATYLADVLAWGHAYRDGVEAVPGSAGPIPVIPPAQPPTVRTPTAIKPPTSSTTAPAPTTATSTSNTPIATGSPAPTTLPDQSTTTATSTSPPSAPSTTPAPTCSATSTTSGATTSTATTAATASTTAAPTQACS